MITLTILITPYIVRRNASGLVPLCYHLSNRIATALHKFTKISCFTVSPLARLTNTARTEENPPGRFGLGHNVFF
ncbi:hypothetical protein BACCAP_04838 [Pseudoflavonifractor capillosus ATCC 29799]|uniref:Uncharacterized protein n=1 Tax=Pseudoflavonifractor capillosus ATCC 29799 TaxID=411467 RepID=A6P2V5_9FIRM|nr:hypothetical protein BACCAP_04838 [Pseudoflavonifractor capillosus ATCC 29799]